MKFCHTCEYYHLNVGAKQAWCRYLDLYIAIKQSACGYYEKHEEVEL